jgi:hypothetical protein
LESSGIGASLKNFVNLGVRYLRSVGAYALITILSAANLAGQASGSDRRPASPDLPRFTLREIVTGSNDTLSRIPGPWLQAAMASNPESLALAGYHKVAASSGVAALPRKALESDRLHHVMGLYRREELTSVARRTLASIRATIPGDTARARFDRLFRPRGEWVVDLHDAALAWTRGRVPGLTWGSAQRALAAAHWLDLSDSLTAEAVPRALYGLTVLAATDSAAFTKVDSEMWRADSISAAAVRLLLSGYAQSQRWYTEALIFFLTQRWIPDGSQGRSLADYVREDWRQTSTDGAEIRVPVPEIRPRLFGYPQAVPHYGVPTTLFQRLIAPQNASAQRWLDDHGEAGLLRTLRWMPMGDTSLVLLQAGSESLRLTTVPRQVRESLNGFLEPGDVILIDPGYSPLLALGTVVHEWQHLLFRRSQLDSFARSLPAGPLTLVELPGIEPYLAEGFAEWSSERILAPLHTRWPLMALGELEKRAGLAIESTDDQHSVGYALVRSLAVTLRDPAVTTRLLLRHAEDPARIARRPELRQAWRAYRRAPDRLSAVPARKILIPEVTFTVEDGFPDVVARRIIVPPVRKIRR